MTSYFVLSLLGHRILHGKTIKSLGSLKASSGIAPGPPQGWSSTPHKNPNCNGQHADTHWVMAYGHKTQSLMKYGGQQKYLDKVLLKKRKALTLPVLCI